MERAEQRKLRRETRIAERRQRLPQKPPTLLNVIDSMERHAPKQWARIHPTLCDREGLRYEIAEEMATHYLCYVKAPSQEMSIIGCDRCSGPHNPANQKCRGTTFRTTLRPFTPTRPLYALNSGEIVTEDLIVGVIEWNDGKQRAGRVLIARGVT
jgi:hypothetical protein